MYLIINAEAKQFSVRVESSTGWSPSAKDAKLTSWEPILAQGARRNSSENNTIDISPTRVSITRSFDGSKQLYYSVENGTIHISDVANTIAKNTGSRIRLTSCYELIYFEYTSSINTLYENIYSLNNDSCAIFSINQSGDITVEVADNFTLPFSEFESTNERAFAHELRRKITAAHEYRASDTNIVLLSGGIDSQVMGIALTRDLGLTNVSACTFHVTGATQTEVGDAEEAARQLNVDWKPIAVDPQKECDWQGITSANSPYIGRIAMDQMLEDPDIKSRGAATIFAGQDTRLHTPALGAQDQRLWRTIFASPALPKLTSGIAQTASRLLKKTEESNFSRRLARLFEFSPDFPSFLANRYFHVRRFDFNCNSKDFKSIYGEICHRLEACSPNEKRATYNKIVEENWRRQYLFDIGHMSGSIASHNFHGALPFYDKQLSQFSAQLPFDLTTRLTEGRAGHAKRAVKVNKYLLRKAYEGDLDKNLIFRDKAVCATNHLFLNGALASTVDSFIRDEAAINSPAGKRLHFEAVRAICQSKRGQWQERDNWLGNIVFNTLVVWTLIQQHGYCEA